MAPTIIMLNPGKWTTRGGIEFLEVMIMAEKPSEAKLDFLYRWMAEQARKRILARREKERQEQAAKSS